jgi:hypothetical protein
MSLQLRIIQALNELTDLERTLPARWVPHLHHKSDIDMEPLEHRKIAVRALGKQKNEAEVASFAEALIQYVPNGHAHANDKHTANGGDLPPDDDVFDDTGAEHAGYDDEPEIDDAPPIDDDGVDEDRVDDDQVDGSTEPPETEDNGIAGVAFTIFTKSNGPLTKSIELGADGALVSNSSECMMAHGRARRAYVKNTGEFADLISALGQNEAIGLGQLLADLGDDVAVVTVAELNGGSAIARTAQFISYTNGEPAFLLIDHDTKGMPDEVRERLQEAGGFWPALVSVCPVLKGVGRVERASTSAGLYRTDTGAKLKGSDGQHIYIVIREGTDAERFLSDLHDRCTLAGFGWGMIGEAGQFLERSAVDRTVGGPERLAFEGRPVLKAPLEQDAEVRQAKAIAGGALDTLIAWAPLTVVEKSKLAEMRAKERARLGVEANRKRDAYVKKHGGTYSAQKACD